MFNNTCPHCGSKYISFLQDQDSFEKSSKLYYCQSCKKEFSVDTAKASAYSEWLMTVYGDSRRSPYNSDFKFYDTKLEIYRNAGGIVMNQKKNDQYSTIQGAPKVYLQFNQYNSKYYIWFDTNGIPNNANGAYVVAEQIELNEELTKKALENEAMRIVYLDGKKFNIPSPKETVLLQDILAWLLNALGISAPARSGGCYVATAVYGSYDCPQVWTLRRFRDESLAKTVPGRLFVRTYYALSPTLVKWFGKTRWFQTLWKKPLDRMVCKLQANGFASTPYSDRIW